MSGEIFSASKGGVSTFEQLTDVDADLSALAQRLLAVNAAGDKVIGTSGLYWDAVNGRLGVETIPAETVHISKNGLTEIYLDSYTDTSYYRPLVSFRRARGTSSSPTNTQSGDYVGSFEFKPRNATLSHACAGITAYVDGALGATYTPGRLSFVTSNGSAAAAERVVIKGSGDFGINVVPTARLHVKGSADDEVLILQAHSTQTKNITEWQDSSNAVISAIAKNGAFKPAQLADAAAENGTIYYSTTASKLVFKDLAGNVQALY